MSGAVWKGAAAGAVVGVMVGLLLGLVMIGTDDIPGFADKEDLAPLYVIAAMVGAIAGAVVGLLGLVLAAGVASARPGSRPRRRVRGSLAAAGVSALAGMIVVAPVLSGYGLVAVVALAALGGGVAWLLLPGVVDLDASPAGMGLPPFGTPPGTAAAARPVSRTARWLWTVGIAVAVFYVSAGVAGNAATAAGASRDTAGVIAFVVALAVGAVAAVSTCLVMGRRR